LAAAGLDKPVAYNGVFADWEDWRLVLLGKEYRPIYTPEEWSKTYG